MANWNADASLSVGVQGLEVALPYTLPFLLEMGLNSIIQSAGVLWTASASLASTATATAEVTRNQSIDASLAITATATPSSTRSVTADSSLSTTATPISTDTRNANVDGSQSITIPGLEQSTVTFDAVGAGANSGAGTTTSLSWSHTAAAGADVFVFVLRGGSTTTATYDGVSMDYVGAASLNNDANNGVIYVFRKSNVAAGTKTVAITFGAATYASATSVSYLNVGAVTTSAAYAGAALTASQTTSGADKCLVVNAIGQYCGGVDTFVSSSGGTQRYQGMGSAKYMNLVVQDTTSTGSTTFSSTVTAAATVSGSISLVLSPLLSTQASAKQVQLLSTSSSSCGQSASITWSHTIESNASLLVVAWNGVSSSFFPGCTVNGQAMTAVSGVTYNASVPVAWVGFFYYVNPPAGSQSIVINGGGSGAWMNVTSFTFKDAKAIGSVTAAANNSVSPTVGGNDLLLNIIGGWISASGGFTGYNQSVVYDDPAVVSGHQAAMFGYARGPTATFSVSSLISSYGGYGNAVLPIKTLNDYIPDAAQSITATISSTATRNQFIDASLSITATVNQTVFVNPVIYDSTGAGNGQNAGTLTWSHTIGSSANCLIVGITSATTYVDNVPTCQVGSTYMKILGVQSWDTNRFTVLYGLLNPPTGTQTITVVGQTSYTGGNSVAYKGVSGFSVPENTSGVGTSISHTASTGVDGGSIVQVLSSNATPAGKIFTNYNQTARWNERTASMFGCLVGDTGGQNAISQFTASQDTAWNWGSTAVTLLPAASAPTGVYFDAVGGAWAQNSAASFTSKHVATQGAYVFCDISVDRSVTLTNVKYGGQNMTLLGSTGSGAAALYRYGYGPVATGGLATVSGTFSVASWNTINTVSYLGMGHAAAPTTTSGASSPSQTVSCSAGQVILESIGVYSAIPTGVSGGYNLFNFGTANNGLVINQSTSSATFTTTNTTAWGAIASILSGPNSTALTITADSTAEPKTGTSFTGDTSLALTATLTSDSLRNAIVAASQAITATPAQAFLRNANVDSATQAITVTLLRDFLRNVNVDSSTQAITAGRVGQDVVTFDSVGVGATGSGTPKTITWNHTISPSANYVIMAVSVLINGAYTYSSFTALLGSTPMTYLGGVESYDTSPGPYSIYFWGMANPPTGTQTFSVGTSSLATYLAANTVAYQNVGAVSPIYPTVGASGTLLTQGPIYGDPSQLIVQAFANGQNVLLSGYSQTIRYNVSGAANVNASLLIGDAKPSLLPALTTIGAGTLATTARTTMTWAQIAQAGDTVLVWAETNTGEYVTTGTYAGVTMTNMGSATSGNVTLTLLVASNVPAGSSTVSVTKNASTHSMQGNSVAYSGVASVTGFVTNTGTSNSPSISVSPSAGTMAVAGLVSLTTADYTNTSGGTLRWTGSGATVQAVFESSSAATFSATSTTSVAWAAIGAILNPSAVTPQVEFSATSSAADLYGAIAIGLIAAPSGLRNANIDSSQAITETLSSAGTRNAIVNVSQALSAVPTSYPVANFKVSSSGVVTATSTGVGSYGAVGSSSLALTETVTSTGSYGAVANSSLSISHSSITFDDAGAGHAYSSYVGVAWNHTATEGSQVWVRVLANPYAVTSVTYNGIAMTSMGTWTLWHLDNAPGGTVSVHAYCPSGATWISGVSVSYHGNITTGAAYGSSGGAGTASLSMPLQQDQLGFVIFHAANGNATGTNLSNGQGGTVRYYTNGAYYGFLVMDAQNADTTFTASTSYGWGAWGLVLDPKPGYSNAASANAIQVITAGDGTPAVKWALKADSPLALTADISALENEAAVAATPLPLTATLTADVSKTRAVESSTQTITATLTANMLRNANTDSEAGVVATITSVADRNAVVDSAETITVTETSVLKWAARVELSEPITATTSITATRAARIDALLAITADLSATPHIDHPANAPLVVTITDTAGANADFVAGASMLISTSSSPTALRSIFFDVELVITETATSKVKWALKAQAAQVITVDSSGTATRNARVNASLQASLGQDDYMFQTESFDVPLNVIADLTAVLNIATTLDSPTLDVLADLTGRVVRLLFADSDPLAITVEIPPPDSLLSHFVEALVVVDNALDGSVVLDAVCNVPLEVSADASVVINQDALIDTDLEIEAIFVSNVVMDALIDAYLDANAGLPAEGIRGQYVDAEQELTFTVTEEVKWHIVMQALLNVPVTTTVDTRSGQVQSNFFVFYI